MKKLLCLLVMLVLCMSVQARSFSYVYKGVKLKCKVTGQSVCVTSFDVKARDVTIPGSVSYKGTTYPVKSVSTFINGANYLTVHLVLEEGIEDIDKFSFNEFRKLRSISLPSSIRHIGRNAIRDNKRLLLDIPSSIDEAAIRNGAELWPTGEGERLSVNQHLAEQAEIESNTAQEKTQREGNATAKALFADVDVNIPESSSKNSKDTYCVIIANEKYADVAEVEYASRDGEVFKEYCMKTLGIPKKHIRTFINASYTDIKRALNWMEQVADVTEGKSRMLFYYAGHGMPNEKDKAAYLIPTDGFPKDITTCYKLSDLYARLGKINTQSVTVFLDACFSGVKRGSGQALVAARGVAIKPKDEVLSGNMVVFTAASDDETALSYQEKRHGMFTYFLLRKLKETKGQVTFGELFKSISSEVKKNSMLENDKLQTPSVNVSSSMRANWEKLRF